MPLVGAGEKSALGFSPGHLINSVELQMPGFQLLKGWGFFGGGGDGLGLVCPPQINNETGTAAQQGVNSNTELSGKILSAAAGAQPR